MSHTSQLKINPALQSVRIGVAGAGVAGLAAALYLKRMGCDVTLLERFDRAQAVGSGLMLQATGLTVLADLGLAEDLLALGRRIAHLQGVDALSGRTVLDVAYRGGRFGLGVQRAALFNVLMAAVIEAGVTLQPSIEVAGVDSVDRNLRLRTTAGMHVEQQFDLVIDATGARSRLRNPDAPGGRPFPMPYGAFWATLDWPEDGFLSDALQQRYRQASVMIGVMPSGRASLGGQQTCTFFWSLKPDTADAVRRQGLEPWKREVVALWPETAALLEQLTDFDQLSLARYAHHTLHQPYDGGIVHIGDSAHATSPQLGQGANMALLDARAIAYALTKCTRLDDVGPTYARMRRWHVRVFQAASRFLTPFYQSDSRLVPLARDTLVSTVARIPPMPMLLASLVSGTLVDPFHALGLEQHPI